MIDLATAAVIAKTLGDSVGALDKIFRGLADFFNAKQGNPDQQAPPADLSYQDDPAQSAMVAVSLRTGDVYQTVTYADLMQRISREEADFITSQNRVIGAYIKQWQAISEEIPLHSGLPRQQLESQRAQVARDMAKPLQETLDLIQKIGFFLDDHYHVARHITLQLQK